MAKKIGLVGIYFPGAYDALHENVPEGFELVDALSPEAYGNLTDCEYLISRLDIDPDIINHTPNVKFWQRWGAGFDHVDLKAWGERGIPIATCPGVNSGIVAELAIMLMLAGYRNLLQINRQLRAGHWPRTEYFGRSFMIKGKTVGVLGLGHIGKKVAALASAFGANVIYYDIVRQPEQEEQFGYRFVDFDMQYKFLHVFKCFSCHLNIQAATIVAMASATGILIQTPTVPQMDGNTNNDGIKNSNCRVNDKKIAFLAIPMDWKKLEVTIWKPTTGKKINTIRKPSTVHCFNCFLYLNLICSFCYDKSYFVLFIGKRSHLFR